MRAIPPEMREEVEKLERKHAENPEGRYFVPLANALRKAGDIRRARELLREGLEKHPDYVSAHIVLGRCLQDEGDLREAEERFRHVLTLDAQNLVALRAMGDIAAGAARVDDARRWFDLLLEVDPMNEEARIALEELSSAPAAGRAQTAPSSEPEAAIPSVGGAPAGFEEGPFADPRGIDYGSGMDHPAVASLTDSGEPAGQADISLPPETEEEAARSAGPRPAVPEDDAPRVARSLDFDRYAGMEEGEFEDEGTVITETIAELYVRQGFYGRAVGVYQELIRRRGPDAGLEERLARARRLASGEREEVAPASEVAPGTSAPGDPFAESFAEGFPTPEAGVSPAGAGARRAVEIEEPASGQGLPPRGIGDYLRSLLAWTPGARRAPEAAAPLDTQDAHPGPAGVASEPEQPGGSPEGTPAEHDFVESYTWAESDVPLLADISHTHEPQQPAGGGEETSRLQWLEPTLESTAAAEAGPAEGSSVADSPEPSFEQEPLAPPSSSEDDLFPWELPVEHREPTESSYAVDRTADRDAPSEPAPAEYRPSSEEVASREPFAIEQPEQAGSPPAPSAERPRASDEDDDDLESFQAWLRSLKR